ncbi:hypothetical protein PV08_09332 [Exophiala spinifera]|uniref:NmrA-like domain-containing protein n=1 Tax=Exophiala spinifera TaxID=91928 RepID=A0A0D2AZF4_9EURO|nr:uncharacterized protein PV08_09332 [Exophiala spinifera]KIW12058.1 hypothetical protein PV08_09332 [Exophiala spinifera]
MKKLAVFPASGKLGSATYQTLSKLLPPQQLVLISRHPEKVPEDLIKAGIETRKADYDAPETLKNVFDGISYLLLVSYPSIQIEHRFRAHQNAMTAALESTPGIEHAFYTSLGFGGDGRPSSAAYVMQAHLRTEAWLREVANREGDGFTFTVIREGIYSETWPMYTSFFDPRAGNNSTAYLPHDGTGPGIAWACIRDLGEATARLIKEYIDNPSDPRYVNKIIILTGPRDWSLKETVEVLGRLGGGGASIEQVSSDEHAHNPKVVEKIGSHGPGNSVARDWTTVFEAVRNGETSVVNGELERLLGRAPESFEETAKRMLAN